MAVFNGLKLDFQIEKKTEPKTYTQDELRKLVAEKVMFKPRLKDVDKRIYKVEKL